MKLNDSSKETLLEIETREALENFFDSVKVIDINSFKIKGTSDSCRDTCGVFRETGECICKKAYSTEKTVSRFVKRNNNYELYCCSTVKDRNGKKTLFICRQNVDDTFELTGNANNSEMKEICRINSSAYKDPLTGLSNRKFVDDNVRYLCKECSDSRKLFSVLCIDIDNFKRYNDEYGHDIGDKVLKLLAEIMTKPEIVKTGKVIPIRIGGDEFIAIGCGVNRHDFLKYANSLLINIAKEKVDTKKGNTSVSISIGISDSSKINSYEYGELYTEADNKLYEAKNKGRNQICY